MTSDPYHVKLVAGELLTAEEALYVSKLRASYEAERLVAGQVAAGWTQVDLPRWSKAVLDHLKTQFEARGYACEYYSQGCTHRVLRVSWEPQPKKDT